MCFRTYNPNIIGTLHENEKSRVQYICDSDIIIQPTYHSLLEEHARERTKSIFLFLIRTKRLAHFFRRHPPHSPTSSLLIKQHTREHHHHHIQQINLSSSQKSHNIMVVISPIMGKTISRQSSPMLLLYTRIGY